MRESKRIPVTLKLLEQAWKQAPDLRLGQLLIAVSSNRLQFIEDIFNIEEPEWDTLFTEFIQENKELKAGITEFKNPTGDLNGSN